MTTPISCFSADNFQKAKEQINFRISVSGMGKFYIEHPADSSAPNDGKKRPPRFPERVYDTYLDLSGDIIHFKSPKL